MITGGYKRYSVSLRIQPKCRKIQTWKVPNTDTFYAVEDVEQKSYEFYYVLPLSIETITLRK